MAARPSGGVSRVVVSEMLAADAPERDRITLMDTAGAIDEYVNGILRAEYARIEWAIERAMQDGVCGVKVIRCGGRLISAEPDFEVPYGQLHEYLLREKLFDALDGGAVIADFMRWYREDHPYG